MRVSKGGLPIDLPIGGHHRGTTPPSARQDENRAPERQPSRASDFGVLIEPTIELRDANRAKHQVPVALSKPSTKFPEQ